MPNYLNYFTSTQPIKTRTYTHKYIHTHKHAYLRAPLQSQEVLRF